MAVPRKPLNQVNFEGNSVYDPKVLSRDGQTTKCSLVLAQNKRWKSSDGAEHHETIFAPVEVFGRAAEQVIALAVDGRPTVRKGSSIRLANAEIRYATWTDKKTGEQRSKMYFAVNQPSQIVFLDPPPRSEGETGEVSAEETQE